MLHLQIICMTAIIHTIPVITRLPPDNAEFLRGSYRITLSYPKPFIKSLDTYCQWYHQRWWASVRPVRAEAQLRPSVIELAPNGYIDYSEEIDQIPVEAISGKALPVAPEGYSIRERLSACSGGCQDIRDTVEWILTAVIMGQIQERARRRFVFPCPEGTKATINRKPSRRRAESPAKESAALGLFNSVGIAELTKPPTGDYELYGDRNPIVIGCYCKELTADELAKEARELAHRTARATAERKRRREKAVAEASRAQFAAAAAATDQPVDIAELPRPRPRRRWRDDTTVTLRSTYLDAESEIPGPSQLPNTTCHDIGAPEVGIPVIGQQNAADELDQATQDDFSEFLRASLSMFSGYQVLGQTWDGSSSSNPRDKHIG